MQIFLFLLNFSDVSNAKAMFLLLVLHVMQFFLFICFPDLQNLNAKISRRALDGARVTLEQTEQIDSILVENLHPDTTSDMLTLYFESKRGGNQKVKEVIMLSEATAKVSFVKYECKFCTVQPLKRFYCSITVVLINKMSFF